jgi:hypothetical protein
MARDGIGEPRWGNPFPVDHFGADQAIALL